MTPPRRSRWFIPSVLNYRSGHLVCETKGAQRGRTVLSASVNGPHTVAMAADSDKLTRRFEAAMQAKYGTQAL